MATEKSMKKRKKNLSESDQLTMELISGQGEITRKETS